MADAEATTAAAAGPTSPTQQKREEDEAAGDDVAAGAAGDSEEVNEKELEDMVHQIKALEEERAKLNEMQKQVQQQLNGPAGGADDKEVKDVDMRSVYVGNVDYATTPEELQAHFKDCGVINRITILCDKFTGQPKGFAYIEFASADSVTAATNLDGSNLHNRPIKVTAKRSNRPGLSTTNRYPPRGRGSPSRFSGSPAGFRGRPRFRSRRYNPYAAGGY